MAEFNSFFRTLLKHEGGFVNDPADPGGATNKGVTMRTFQKCAKTLLDVDPTLENLKTLSDEQCAVIYKRLYWDKVRGDDIKFQPLADIVFDFQVNAGANASKLLQTILNSLGASPKLIVDGGIGRQTMDALSKADSRVVYARYKQGRKDYYKGLVAKRPSLEKFLKGWLARTDTFPDFDAA